MDNQPAEPKPDRRHTLIMAAFQTIAQKGFEGLRVRDVAAQVGINGATLHHYFPTKEALIQAVVEYTIKRLMEASQDLTGSPAEQIHSHIQRLRRLMSEEPALFIALAEIGLRAQRDPLLEYLVEQERSWQEYLANIIRAGINQHYWPNSLDPDGAASAIITAVEGSSFWIRTLPERADQAIRQLEQWLQTD